MISGLYELEQLFWTAVRSRAAPEDVERAFSGRGALDARARLAIYTRMYVARQVNALRDAHPKLALRLGERFEHLAREYLRVHPSREPAIEWIGLRFNAFTSDRDPCLGALARLEWARHGVLLAPDPLELVTLSELDPARFALARIEFVPAHDVVQVWMATLAIWNDPLIDPPIPTPAPGARDSLHVAVWRAGTRVLQRVLEADEAIALAAARAGAPLSEVCVAFCAARDPVQRASIVLGRWFESQWIARVRYPAPEPVQ